MPIGPHRPAQRFDTLKFGHNVPHGYEYASWVQVWAPKLEHEVRERIAGTRLMSDQQSTNEDRAATARQAPATGALASFIDRRKRELLFFVAGRDESFTDQRSGRLCKTMQGVCILYSDV